MCEMSEIKLCSKCKELKPLSDFYNNKNSKDGHDATCIKCQNLRYRHVCNFCRKNFTSKNKNHKGFRFDCKVKNETKDKARVCPICNKKYQYKKQKQKYCSKKCLGISQRKEKTIYICDYCKKEFERLACFVNGKHHIFCSYECKDKANGIFYVGENHPMWNKEKTQDERERERSYSDYTNWRNKVYERDNYVCQCCGDNQGGNLNAHHLDSYDWCAEKRIDIDNGITLCVTCHKKFHSKYGYGNNTHAQFKEFLNTVIMSEAIEETHRTCND